MAGQGLLSLFIVEDDVNFRETFIDAMGLKGIAVRAAGSGLEGLAALRDHTPHVIVLDVQLPDIHGFDLCKMIRRIDSLRKVPILFVSASAQYSDPRDRVDGILAGASGFLPKPITPDKLLSEIESLLPANS